MQIPYKSYTPCKLCNLHIFCHLMIGRSKQLINEGDLLPPGVDRGGHGVYTPLASGKIKVNLKKRDDVFTIIKG